MKSFYGKLAIVTLALILLAGSVQSQIANCNYVDSTTKCQLCNTGYGLSPDKTQCFANQQANYVPYCRIYRLEPDTTKSKTGYACDLCYCEYAFNIDKTICIPNDFFGVQGCHQYQSFGLCQECKWTWQPAYKVVDTVTDFNTYMNVDLGLSNDQKTCTTNTGINQYCLQYDATPNCKTCQLRAPIYPVDNPDLKQLPLRDTNAAGTAGSLKCPNYYFVNQELYSTKTSDASTPCVNSNDAASPYIKLQVLSKYLDRTDFVDSVTTPVVTNTFYGCFKQFDANCLTGDDANAYDWDAWRTAVKATGSTATTRYTIKCKKCATSYILKSDGSKCVQNAQFCTYADPATTPAPAALTNWDCITCNTYYFLWTQASGVTPNRICIPLYQCSVQQSPSGSTYPSKCATCNSLFRSGGDGVCKLNLWHVVVSGGTTTYTLRNYQGCLKETSATDDKCNACDTALGYSTTPVVSGSVATCNCDTGYTKFTDSATNDPINAWYPINPLSCIFNAAVTDNCFEYLDSRRCKRCKARYALTPIGTCEIEPADGSANKLANCQASYNVGVNHPVCKICEKGYGILAGIFQSISVTTGTPATTTIYTELDNGKCSNSADPTLLKYFIANCMKYAYRTGTSDTPVTYTTTEIQITAGTPTNFLTCEKCRPGYKVTTTGASANIACEIDDTYFEYTYNTGTTSVVDGAGCDFYTNQDECSCKSGRIAVFQDITTRDQFCITSANAITNCVEYSFITTPGTTINTLQCNKCLVGYLVADKKRCSDAVADVGAGNRPANLDACYEDPYYDINAKKPAPWVLDSFFADDPLATGNNICLKNDANHNTPHCAKYGATAIAGSTVFPCDTCRKGYGVFEVPAGSPGGTPKRWNPQGTTTASCAVRDNTPLVGSTCAIAAEVPAVGGADPTSSCVACNRFFIPIRGTGTSYKYISYCDSTDDFQTRQVAAVGGAITLVATPHPACFQATKVTDARETKDYVTCDVGSCIDPYIRVQIGVYLTGTAGSYTENKLYSCALPTVDRCRTYDGDSGKCTGCYWPFYLVQTSPPSCLPEGCIQALSGDATKCQKCYSVATAPAGISSINYMSYFLSSTKQQCQRNTYVANCIQYSGTADECVACDTATPNSFYFNPSTKVCVNCLASSFQIWVTATKTCLTFTRCTAVASGACTTCQTNYGITNDGAADCLIKTTGCQRWKVDSQSRQTCVQCTSSTYSYLSDYTDCVVSTEFPNCYQLDSNRKCAICYDGYQMLSDGKCKISTTFTQTWAPHCIQFAVDSTATDFTQSLCMVCNPLSSVIVLADSKQTTGKCFEGCAELSLYNNKLCRKCRPGWGLDNIDWTYGGFCRSDGTIKRDVLKSESYPKDVPVIFIAAVSGSLVNCAQYDRQFRITNQKCIRCHPGFFIYNGNCIRNQGSCMSTGCNFLLNNVATTGGTTTVTAAALSEKQQCHNDMSTLSAGTVPVASQISVPTGLKVTGCMVNDTSNQMFFDYNSQTKKCDYYSNPMPATPNDGSGLPSGPINLGTTGNDGGIAPTVNPNPPTPTPPNPTPVTPSTSTTSASFLSIGIETILIVIFGVLAYIA